MTEKYTRNEARAAYKAADLDYFPLTFERMRSLRDFINYEFLEAALMDGTLHMKHPSTIKVQDGYAELRCQSHYFDDREAVTFGKDGFIGFAGWADDQNVQPIIRGFMEWVRHEEELAELN